MRSLSPIAFAIVLFGPVVAESQEIGVLFLPQDEQLVDEITIVGTRETRLSSGLSRLSVPDSDTTYYVIDETHALQGHLFEDLIDISRNDSDVSIGYDRYRSEFIHIRLGADALDVRYFHVEPALLLQISEFFREGGFASGRRSVDVLEYQIPINTCPDLESAVGRMEELLQDAVSNIGVPPEPADVFVVDGIGYQLRVRLDRTQGIFGIGENSGPLFDPVHSIMLAARACSTALEPDVGTRDF